jgi:hypothetical protein
MLIIAELHCRSCPKHGVSAADKIINFAQTLSLTSDRSADQKWLARRCKERSCMSKWYFPRVLGWRGDVSHTDSGPKRAVWGNVESSEKHRFSFAFLVSTSYPWISRGLPWDLSPLLPCPHINSLKSAARCRSVSAYYNYAYEFHILPSTIISMQHFTS